MAGRYTSHNSYRTRPLWKQLAGMSNTEWADFHEKFSRLPLSEKFRGVAQIHDSWTDYICENDDRRFSEADHNAYTGLCRTLYAWSKIDQSPSHETGKQTALAEAVAGDEKLQSAAQNWESLDHARKLDAMDRVQQLHARIYGIEPAAKITAAPRYMNAGMGMDACYDHDHMFPDRCENKIFADTLDHFGDAVQATLHGASMRVTEHQRMEYFGGSDDTTCPDAVQGSMFHMDFFTSTDLWGHEEGEFGRYIQRPRISYARETAGAVMDSLKERMDGVETTITDTKREAVYRIGKIEEHLTDGRVHDRDRSVMQKIDAVSNIPDEQIAGLDTGLKAHLLADLQHEAADRGKPTQKAAFALGNRVMRLTELEPEFVARQQQLEEHLVNRMRNDPGIARARKNWKKLSTDDRVATLEKAVRMHAETYGYNTPQLETYDQPRNTETRRITNGVCTPPCASAPDCKIRINTNADSSFGDFQGALNTTLHEATHANQFQLGAKFATSRARKLGPAEQKQARQFFWTTKMTFYGNADKIGYENYRAQNIEKHAFSQGNVLAARVSAKPDLREKVDQIARRVRGFSDTIGQKVSLARPKRQPAKTGMATS